MLTQIAFVRRVDDTETLLLSGIGTLLTLAGIVAASPVGNSTKEEASGLWPLAPEGEAVGLVPCKQQENEVNHDNELACRCRSGQKRRITWCGDYGNHGRMLLCPHLAPCRRSQKRMSVCMARYDHGQPVSVWPEYPGQKRAPPWNPHSPL